MAHIKPLREKAYLYIIAFFAIMLAASFLIGCGSDTITNTGTNPPINTGLLSIDTFGVFNQRDAFIDSVLSSTVFSKTVKVEFRAETNCTNSDLMTMAFKYKEWKSLHISDTLNRSFSFTLTRDTAQATNVEMNILISTAQNNKYVRFVNFNVYKID